MEPASATVSESSYSCLVLYGFSSICESGISSNEMLTIRGLIKEFPVYELGNFYCNGFFLELTCVGF